MAFSFGIPASTNHPKYINTEGKENSLFDSVDENVESNEAFENRSYRKFDFELKDQHISVKGNFKKQNYSY